MITSSRCQGMGRAEELGCRPLGRAISFSSAMTILKTIQLDSRVTTVTKT